MTDATSGRKGREADRRFILVTGMPRSGTTAVGSALASAGRTAYYYEPLNRLSGLRSIQDWFLFPDGDGASTDLDHVLDRVFALDVTLKSGLWDADPGWRRAVKHLTGSRSRVSALRCRLDPTLRTVVWKDPFASFLVPVLAGRGLPVVVTIRAPEASAASFKRLGWGFDVHRLHTKLRAMTPGADYLDVDLNQLEVTDSVVNGALVWRLVYGHLDAMLAAGGSTPRVVWCNTRALIAEPVSSYATIFDQVGLPFAERSRRFVEREHRDQGRAQPDARRAHDRHRNVNEANRYWQQKLGDGEREVVRELTAGVRESVERRTGPL